MRVTLVMPVHNEAEVIERVVREYHGVLAQLPDAEFIVAEDGSSDATPAILAKLAKGLPLRLVTSRGRKGYTQAVRDALALATNEVVLFSDSDGQHCAADFLTLLPKLAECDMVVGYRRRRCDPWHRIAISRAYNWLACVLFGLRLHDMDCGFRAMSRRLLADVGPEVRTLKHCISSEYVIRAHQKGYRIKEVVVTHRPRPHGDTRVFPLKRLPGVAASLLLGMAQMKLEFLAKPSRRRSA